MKKEGSALYQLVHKNNFLSIFIRKGGLTFKWTMIISLIILVIVFIFSLVFTIMSTNALMASNDKLCQTIAGNISSTESILTAEGRPFKRSLILQDIVNGLSKSEIAGLEYAAVYDFRGKLVEKEKSFAAHTKSLNRAQEIPEDVFREIQKVNKFEKKRVLLEKNGGKKIPCYQYRMPFKFFKVTVGVIEIVFTEESIIGPVNEAKRYVVLLGLALLIFGIIVSVTTTRGMVKPIHKLSNGMNSVRDGNLDIELNVKRHDELGELSIEFNNMINHLREKLQMQKFVSDSTISMIKEKSKSGDIGLGGTRENYAFLFSDVRGFTAMSEKLEPEEVVGILNEYLDLQAQIIKRNGGDIDKFVGDEVMAVFSGEDKANNAILAAIEIIDSISELNEKRTEQDQRIISVGVGLNVGDVVHGRMGSRDRMDNTSIGDAVNLAARLCSQADPGIILASDIIVSEATRGKFKGKKLEPIRVKGKVKAVEIFSITGVEEV